ncbi:MAG TPA: hypothetical protein VFQ53_08580 [Kofleriaceae bacterium]|nr:hypothetical protein [Kofleriaceae bacterium]
MRLGILLVWLAGCQFAPVPVQPGSDAPDGSGSDGDVTPPIDACAACPDNDVAAGAIAITDTRHVSGDFTAAHDDLATGCGPTGARDLFYELVVPSPQVVYIDTIATAFDGVLSLYPGSCTAAGAQLSCADNPCDGSLHAQLARSLAAGTYCLVVEDGGNTATTFDLDVEFAGRDGIELAGAGPWNLSGNTCDGIDGADPSCESGASAAGTGKDVMYWMTVCQGSHAVRASTCASTGFDSIVYMRSQFEELACRDDGCTPASNHGSLMTSSTTGNGLMMIIVDGYDGACGSYTLNVQP